MNGPVPSLLTLEKLTHPPLSLSFHHSFLPTSFPPLFDSANYAVASCFPYSICATCPNAPMDGVTKAGDLEELFKIEVAAQALKEREASVFTEGKSGPRDDFEDRSVEDGFEARHAKNTGDTEGAAVSKREHAKKDFPEEGEAEAVDA